MFRKNYNRAYLKAVENNDIQLVGELLARPDVDPNYQYKMRKSDTGALDLAIENNRPDIFDLLIEKGANLQQVKYPLHRAVRFGTLPLLRKIIDLSPDLINQQDGNGNTPLHDAIYWNKLDIVKYLIAAGARTDIANDRSRTAYYHAEYHGYKALMDILRPFHEKNLSDQNLLSVNQENAEEWKKLADDRIAHVVWDAALGRKITHIFNFSARERMVICQNLRTNAESMSMIAFDQLG